MRGDTRTWLCPEDQHRARVLENSARVRTARIVAALAIGLSAIAAIPTYGWWLFGLFAVGALNIQTVDARMRRSRRPEYHAAANILVTQAAIACAAALTGGPRSPVLPLIVVPTAFAATRFRAHVAFVATLIPILMILIATLVFHFHETLTHPAELIVTIDVLIGVSAAAQALYGAELQHRNTAILDPLTGLLNRQGLERRFDEIAEQARLMGAPISILVCDLDHFKAVNDSHGHAVGDAVLRDVAYELRKQLRSFELIYRIGGEEFLVVLPGATLAAARTLGERLCEAARSCHTEGLSLTLSVGISTLWGSEVEFRRMFEAADRALYRAKREGRDRVAWAGHADGDAEPAVPEVTTTAATAL